MIGYEFHKSTDINERYEITKVVRDKRIPTKLNKLFEKNRKRAPSTFDIPLPTQGTTTKMTMETQNHCGIHRNSPYRPNATNLWIMMMIGEDEYIL
jgi:hypothetical protein